MNNRGVEVYARDGYVFGYCPKICPCPQVSEITMDTAYKTENRPEWSK